MIGRWNKSSLRTLRSIKNIYFSPKGGTKANHFLCSSILAVLLTLNVYNYAFINKSSYGLKKSSAFASIYLLASIIYCNLFGGIPNILLYFGIATFLLPFVSSVRNK